MQIELKFSFESQNLNKTKNSKYKFLNKTKNSK